MKDNRTYISEQNLKNKFSYHRTQEQKIFIRTPKSSITILGKTITIFAGGVRTDLKQFIIRKGLSYDKMSSTVTMPSMNVTMLSMNCS